MNLKKEFIHFFVSLINYPIVSAKKKVNGDCVLTTKNSTILSSKIIIFY